MIDRNKIFQENWNHARHVENERMIFTQIYIGIIVGSLAITGGLDFTEFTHLLLIGILLMLGWAGFLMTVKLNAEFSHIMKKIELQLKDNPHFKEMGLPIHEGYFIKIKVRYAFLAMYVTLCGVWILLLVIAISANITHEIENSENFIIQIGHVIGGSVVMMAQTIIMVKIVSSSDKSLVSIQKKLEHDAKKP